MKRNRDDSETKRNIVQYKLHTLNETINKSLTIREQAMNNAFQN